MKKRIKITILLLLSTICSTSLASIKINIDSPKFRRLVLAVPTFGLATPNNRVHQQIARQASDRLAGLLQYSGLFNQVKKDLYKKLLKEYKDPIFKTSGLPGIKGVDIAQWKSLNIETMIIAHITQKSDGFEFLLKTIDLRKGESVVGKKYSGVARGDIDKILTKYADHVLKQYTGSDGIFNSKLVFVAKKNRKSSKQIYMSNFDGSDVQQISRGNSINLSPSWSPDGKYITYTSYRDGNPDLFLYDLARRTTKKISSRRGMNSGSTWSHNGSVIAFTGVRGTDTDLFTLSPNGGLAKPFIQGQGLDVDPSFSPNGQYLAYVSARYGNPHLFRATLQQTGKTLKVVSEKRLTYAGWYNTTPDWSPNSSKIIFSGYDKDIDRYDVFVMNNDGTKLERLTLKTGDNEDPNWSPNGQLIIFSSNRIGGSNTKGKHQLYMMSKDGSSQRKINLPFYEVTQADWSKNVF